MKWHESPGLKPCRGTPGRSCMPMLAHVRWDDRRPPRTGGGRQVTHLRFTVKLALALYPVALCPADASVEPNLPPQKDARSSPWHGTRYGSRGRKRTAMSANFTDSVTLAVISADCWGGSVPFIVGICISSSSLVLGRIRASTAEMITVRLGSSIRTLTSHVKVSGRLATCLSGSLKRYSAWAFESPESSREMKRSSCTGFRTAK